jgi:hypothetical protein
MMETAQSRAGKHGRFTPLAAAIYKEGKRYLSVAPVSRWLAHGFVGPGLKACGVIRCV